MRKIGYQAVAIATLFLWQSSAHAAEVDKPQGAAGKEPQPVPSEAEIAAELDELYGDDREQEAPQNVGQTLQNYINISLSGLAAAGYTTAGHEAVQGLQGGAHDPKQRGFTLQNVELSLSGAVDPYFSAEAHLIFQISPEGESVFELEEAFATTQSLPWGFQVKGGTYFTEFGRLNTQHPHRWDFVDQPVVNSRLLGGDGLRNPGARVSWLTPLPWYSELIVGLQDAQGETAVSFLGESEADDFVGVPVVEKPSQNPLVTSRWLNSISPSRELALNIGVSGAMGPNATGAKAQTYLGGVDLFAKWQPTDAYKGWPFVTIQAEAMLRHYELMDSTQGLRDWGSYFQAAWGLTQGWVVAARYDYAGGDGPPTRDTVTLAERHRASANVTYYPTEFSKLRLQYNFDETPALVRESAHSVWLQLEFLLGAHATHTF